MGKLEKDASRLGKQQHGLNGKRWEGVSGPSEVRRYFEGFEQLAITGAQLTDIVAVTMPPLTGLCSTTSASIHGFRRGPDDVGP